LNFAIIEKAVPPLRTRLVAKFARKWPAWRRGLALEFRDIRFDVNRLSGEMAWRADASTRHAPPAGLWRPASMGLLRVRRRSHLRD